jgi:hypothetical protein
MTRSRDLANLGDNSSALENQGLVFINTTAFSAVSSVSLPDNTFTTTYDNYRMMFQGVASTNNDLNIRMRAAGVDASGANYNAQFVLGNGTSVSAARSANATSGRLFEILVANCIASIDIYNPALAVATSMFTSMGARPNSSIAIKIETTGHTLETAYDSMTFIPTSGTITGSVQVYGYKK